jgi:cation diffusion facilitator family transporter
MWAVALAGIIAFAGNELVARYRIRVGRQIGSAALVADGLHARTDGSTSLAVVLGAATVAAGLPVADPVIGLLIAVAILGVLRSAVAQVGARLMDAVNPDLVNEARRAVTTVEGVLDVRDLRLRWIGHTLLSAGSHDTVHDRSRPQLSLQPGVYWLRVSSRLSECV